MFTSAAELQYVAGLYEGEGSCHSGLHNIGSKTLTYGLSIRMQDIEPLQRVQRIIGFGKVNGPHKYKGSKKPMYQYNVSSFEKVQAFIAMIFPLLSPRRQEQACFCLDKEYLNEYD